MKALTTFARASQLIAEFESEDAYKWQAVLDVIGAACIDDLPEETVNVAVQKLDDVYDALCGVGVGDIPAGVAEIADDLRELLDRLTA